jgi:hypothetical protein
MSPDGAKRSMRTTGALFFCVLVAGCGSSKQQTSSSPLSDLAARLPDPQVFQTGLPTGTPLPGAGAWPQILEWATQVDAVRASWCHGRSSVDARGQIQIGTRDLDDQVLLGFHGTVVEVRRQFVAGAVNVCGGGTLAQAFELSLCIAAFAANGSPIPPPWSNSLRLDRVAVYGQFSATGDFATTLQATTPALAFVLVSGVPAQALASASDFVHLPKVADLQSVDSLRFTAMFFPNHIRDAGVAFGGANVVPDVLTVVVDAADAAHRSLLAFADWAAPTNQPVALDLRVSDRSLVGAAVVATAGGRELWGPFFVAASGTAADSGFVLDGSDPRNLLAAWDSAGNVTHTTANQGTFVVPATFPGWPGDSQTWTVPFGGGLSAEFTSALGAVAPVTVWFAHP